MTDDTIQKSDALEYVLENHWDEVKEKLYDEIREEVEKKCYRDITENVKKYAIDKIKEQKEPKKSTTPECPKCGSRHTYYRRRTKDHVCQKCGNTWKEDAEP